jgi:hypothetical protein
MSKTPFKKAVSCAFSFYMGRGIFARCIGRKFILSYYLTPCSSGLVSMIND